MYKNFLLAIGIVLLYGVAGAKSTNAVITGRIDGFKGGTITLNYQSYALLSDLKKQELDVDSTGEFRFDIALSGPTRAFLVAGSTPVEETFTLTKADGKDTTISTNTNRPEIVYLYLKPRVKQRLSFTLGDISNTLRISGKNSTDSYYLNEEDWRFNQYRDKNLKNYFAYVQYGESQYLHYVEDRKAARSEFLNQYATSHKLSKHLRHVAQWTIYSDAVMARLLYPGMRSSYRNETYEAPADYYEFLADVKFDDSAQEKGIAYFYFLDYFLKEHYRLSDSEEDYLDFVAEKMSGKPLYEYYAFALRTNFKRKLYDKFGPSSPYRDLARLVRSKYKDMESILDGSLAPLVTLQNTAGVPTTFKEWEGKYIYLDFWATWCGPCIQEIPHLQTLEHDYAEKDIVFVSISMDRESDRQKWVDFVQERALTGIQVWVDADNHKAITDAFHIAQIPRFVLLDDQGRIVDANAPRPSDKRVRDLFDKVLGESLLFESDDSK